jgi:hypothetical protein
VRAFLTGEIRGMDLCLEDQEPVLPPVFEKKRRQIESHKACANLLRMADFVSFLVSFSFAK